MSLQNGPGAKHHQRGVGFAIEVEGEARVERARRISQEEVVGRLQLVFARRLQIQIEEEFQLYSCV